MKLTSIFNPSNDMALAAHVRQYMPPKRIQQMEADLAALAQVWEGTRFAGPWGWSLAAKQRYRLAGFPVEMLPSDEWLEEVRRLSSREFAWLYLKQMLAELRDVNLLGVEMNYWKNMPSPSEWGNSMMEASPNGGVSEEEAMPQLIFKSPWSSSGRGVFVGDWCDERTRTRLQGFLSSQGGFVVDHFYEDKVLDFAMEFFISEDRTVEFLGYSVFHAAESGAYGYNYVESQQALVQRIGVDESLLQRLIDYHKEHLSQIDYYGPVGIDMLKTSDGCIHPCIEINLRMNMGILALLLHEQHGSGATVALTPEREHGFQALVDEGKLMIMFRP